MKRFMCQMQDYDRDDDWDSVEAYDAEHAAELYAEKCESNSSGDMLKDTYDREVVYVKDDAGNITPFSIYIDYQKMFFVEEVKDDGNTRNSREQGSKSELR